MTRNRAARGGFLAATAICGTLATMPARAATDQQIEAIERQIRALQGELHKVKADLAHRNAELRAQAAR